jgi:HEAT repeat protein
VPSAGRRLRWTSSPPGATTSVGSAAATSPRAKAAKAKLVAYLGDPIEELRVAAAVALRRAGDPAGADVLLKAIEDPVEGPEVRWALTKLAGDDRGDTAGAWEEFVRAGGAK